MEYRRDDIIWSDALSEVAKSHLQHNQKLLLAIRGLAKDRVQSGWWYNNSFMVEEHIFTSVNEYKIELLPAYDVYAFASWPNYPVLMWSEPNE